MARALQSGRVREGPLECRDPVLQNALYTGDLAEVQRHFSGRSAVDLVIQAKSQDLRWTSQKWGKDRRGGQRVSPARLMPPDPHRWQTGCSG